MTNTTGWLANELGRVTREVQSWPNWLRREAGLEVTVEELTVKMDLLADAFNEWMRLFTEEPERFRQQWEDVLEYLDEAENGTTPTYGGDCAKFLVKLINDVQANQG